MLFLSVTLSLQFSVGPAELCAQKETVDKTKNEARFKYMIKAMSKFEARVGDSEIRARLDETALLRWTQPTETIVDGLLLLYTQGVGTRPAVVSDYHVHSNGFEVHEFIAIAADIQMTDGRIEFWKPLTRQGEFKVLPEGPEAAEGLRSERGEGCP